MKTKADEMKRSTKQCNQFAQLKGNTFNIKTLPIEDSLCFVFFFWFFIRIQTNKSNRCVCTQNKEENHILLNERPVIESESK